MKGKPWRETVSIALLVDENSFTLEEKSTKVIYDFMRARNSSQFVSMLLLRLSKP